MLAESTASKEIQNLRRSLAEMEQRLRPVEIEMVSTPVQSVCILSLHAHKPAAKMGD